MATAGRPQAPLPSQEGPPPSLVDHLADFLTSWQKLLVAVGGVVLAAGALFAAIRSLNPTASAPGPSCSAQFTEHVTGTNRWVQDCPLIPGTIPVFGSPDQGSGAQKVGFLPGGSSDNWFVGQARKSSYVDASGETHWWAFTLSNRVPGGHSRWGWVPETFFEGHSNDEPAAGLALCGTKDNACHE